MIDWGKTPPGSVATIYWPQLSSTKVLALAHSIYATHLLSAADGHTIQCVTTRGVTYIPIPHVPNVSFAGLLTIDLPSTVTHGEVFDIMVRRVSSRRGRLQPPPPPGPVLRTPPSIYPFDLNVTKAAGGPIATVAEQPPGFNWRQVCGAFNVRIPVTNAKVMLPVEEDTLAILKWRLKTKPAPYRWRPVWERLIELVGAKVQGLGVDPSEILPSLSGFPDKGSHGHLHPRPRHGGGHEHDRQRDSATGKIGGVCYDRFGHFEGFDLCTEQGEERLYRAHEDEIERLVLQVWRERWVVTVLADCERGEHDDHDAPPRVARIILRGNRRIGLYRRRLLSTSNTEYRFARLALGGMLLMLLGVGIGMVRKASSPKQ